MATVTLTFTGPDAWLTLASDPSLSVHASYPERGHSRETAGEFRSYAGGRVRVITTARKTASFPLTLQLLTDEQVALLESWQGQVVLLRDPAGERQWVAFLACEVVDYWDPAGTLHDVSLNLAVVSFNESV